MLDREGGTIRQIWQHCRQNFDVSREMSPKVDNFRGKMAKACPAGCSIHKSVDNLVDNALDNRERKRNSRDLDLFA
jgi:hypothetical protein